MAVLEMLKLWLIAAAMCIATAAATYSADDNAAPASDAAAESKPTTDQPPTSESDSEKSDNPARKAPEKPSGPPRIVAWVNGLPVYLADVQHSAAALSAGKKLDNNTTAYLQAEILQQLITQTILLKYLEKEHLLSTPQEVD